MLSKQEFLQAVKSMPNDKSPGGDAFTTKNYKVFWLDIKFLLFKSISKGYSEEELSHNPKTYFPKMTTTYCF